MNTVNKEIMSSVGQGYCDVCNKDMKSTKSLAEHAMGKKHLKKKKATAEGETVRSVYPVPSLQSIVDRIATGVFRNIIVLTGAGVSTGSGIPDFRSKGGLFDQIVKLWGDVDPAIARNPIAVLHRSFARKYPKLWTKQIEPWLKSIKGSARPTRTHRLLAQLMNAGIVKRIYTQNIDGLHIHPSLKIKDSSRVVECHGSIEKDNVVLYDDPLPETMYQTLEEDFNPNLGSGERCDLLLVLGTSLQVMPFAAIANLAPKGCTRLWATLGVNGYRRNTHHAAPVHLLDRNSTTGANLFLRVRKGMWRWPQRTSDIDCDALAKQIETALIEQNKQKETTTVNDEDDDF